MSVILVDLANDKNDLQINQWNWRPTIELIRRGKILADEQLEPMGRNGGGAQVSTADARSIALFIEQWILPGLKDDEMMHMDGAISKCPLKPRPIPGTDPYQLYAARKTWLVMFVDFCKSCGGFEVV
jgi:hypothetical protein